MRCLQDDVSIAQAQVRVLECPKVLRDHLIVNQDSQFADEVERPLRACLLSFALLHDSHDLAATELLQHRNHQMIQCYGFS